MVESLRHCDMRETLHSQPVAGAPTTAFRYRGCPEALSTALQDSEEDFRSMKENQLLLRKQDLRILPICAMMYLLAFVDRTNIGNAKVMNAEEGHDMRTELNITGRSFSFALVLFFIAYTIFEVPSNYLLKMMGPSRWFSFILFGWGCCSYTVGYATDSAQLYALRFLIGISFRLALIFATATLAGVFGGFVASGISEMDGMFGSSGWRWLFWIEGAPTVFFAIVVYKCLPDYPEHANFLTPDEIALAKRRMAATGSKGNAANMSWKDVAHVLMDWRLYLHYAVYFLKACPFSSLSLFTPSIVKGLGYTSHKTQLLTVPPYAMAFLVTVALALYCDQRNRRAFVSAVLMFIGAVGFLTLYCLPLDSHVGRYCALIVSAVGSFATFPILLGWLSSNLRTTSAQGFALGLNVAIGSPAQILGVWIYPNSHAANGYRMGHSRQV
ncbi:hypothetical protein TD95_001619 [Thielaviopsis punctulata]|uniref:Major facilitator superfamily (MFS) profile domain-containing protein n=1 Tax=Thielaviopsis punctulata TaxID=72032 RepID=A0A0F4ZA12_9PEZI|nr:hypothetical protein TD95_001619 [Thielaviopsis punctulata]